MRKSESIFAFTQDREGRILLVKNKEEERKRGRFVKPAGWGLPGGSVETDETETEALSRELEEETGISKTEVEIDITDRNLIYWEKKWDREGNGRIHWIFVLHAKLKVPADLLTLKSAVDADVERASWFSIDDLPKDLYRSHQRRINFFLETLGRE